MFGESFKKCSKNVSKVECLMDVSKKLQECFLSASKVIKSKFKYFQGSSENFRECLKKVLKMFHRRCFLGVTGKLDCIKKVSKLFPECFKEVVFCYFVAEWQQSQLAKLRVAKRLFLSGILIFN